MAFDFACPDWAEKLVRGETPIADLDLDEDRAAQAVNIFNKFRVPDVIGRPELREVAGEWIRDIVRAIFGSMHTSDLVPEVRLVGEVFILVPKKNGKSTNAAAIALTFMLLNERPRADMLIIGPTQKISDVAFQQACGMIEADEYLTKRFHCVGGNEKTIYDRQNKSRLMVRTFGMNVVTGAKPVFCLIDEVHLLGSIPYAADVIRQIRGGMMIFPEAVLVMITTQSDHPPDGVFKSELQYARGVRDGRISDGVKLLPVLYEFPEALQTARDEPWRNPDLWYMVTPSLNKPITIDQLTSGYQRALEDGHHELVAWATQHLNVEVGMALHSNRWIGADHWEAAGDSRVTLATIINDCDVAVTGIDGGGLDDLMALSIVGRHRDTKKWLHWAHAWAHPEVLVQRKEIAARLHDFEAAGELTICTYPTQDVVELTEYVMQVFEAGLLPTEQAIGYDPYGIAALVDEMVGRGIPEAMMIGIRQGSALSPATWGLERKLKDGTFVHGAQPLMAWAVSNAIAEQRGNAVLITKQTAGKAKIDPLVATLNAVMLMARNPMAAGGSSYLDTDELMVF